MLVILQLGGDISHIHSKCLSWDKAHRYNCIATCCSPYCILSFFHLCEKINSIDYRLHLLRIKGTHLEKQASQIHFTEVSNYQTTLIVADYTSILNSPSGKMFRKI